MYTGSVEFGLLNVMQVLAFRGNWGKWDTGASGTHKHFLSINKMQVIARRWKPFSDQSYLPARPFQANLPSVKFYKTRQHPLLMSTEVSLYAILNA